jgi:hypothetical protein
MVIGQIMLRLLPTVQQNHTNYVTSYSLWDALKGSYSKATALTVFKDFKDCLNACISLTADPNIYFDMMFSAFAQMSAADVEVPAQLQVMIALATLPQKWEMLISVITGDVEMSDLDLGEVCDTIITQFQVDSVHHGSNKHNANKISAVTLTGATNRGRTSSSKVMMAKPSASVTAEAQHQLGRLVGCDGKGDVLAQSLGQA